ncbi:hypothetical protein FCI58_16340 [Enterobacter hormaechei]|nr:hypothetical protein [Enterobacter hormaechei]
MLILLILCALIASHFYLS